MGHEGHGADGAPADRGRMGIRRAWAEQPEVPVGRQVGRHHGERRGRLAAATRASHAVGLRSRRTTATPSRRRCGAYKNASWCGAFDMAGNVWQWCQDYFNDKYYARVPGC